MPSRDDTPQAVVERLALLLATNVTSEQDPDFIVFFRNMTSVLDARGSVDITLPATSDHLLVNNQPLLLENEALRELARVLRTQGVLALSFVHGLEALHLIHFFQIYTVYREHLPNDTHDLVTYWFEEGEQPIRFQTTSLAHLSNKPPARQELERALATTLGLGEPLRVGDPPPLMTLTPIGRSERRSLDILCEAMRMENESTLRRHFSATLLAVSGANSPALSAQEVALLFAKIVGEQIFNAEWEDILKAIRNLETMSDPSAKVATHTLEVTTACLKKLATPQLFLKLIEAVADGIVSDPPHRILRWWLSQSALDVWKFAVDKSPHEHLPTIIALFGACYAFQHPFWQEATQSLPEQHKQRVRDTIASLETQWIAPEHRRPSTGAVKVRIPDDDDPDMLWQSMDLGPIDDGFPNELDASLMAFLDATDSQPGQRRKNSAIPRSMLDHLDALEKSLLKAGQDSNGED